MILRGIHYKTEKLIEIEIEDGIIRDITESNKIDSGRSDLYIAPGLIDNQTNGYAGIDFSHESFNPEGMRNAAMALWKDGTTTFLPTLITGRHSDLLRNFKILGGLKEDPRLLGSIPGFHLEGPYLSKEPGFYGCHPIEYLRDPSLDEFKQYQEASKHNILQVTLSPELNGAMQFISWCTKNGVIISLGHTNASAEVINLAVESGARLSTHLGNGCANMINRHKNPIWPQLANDLLTPSIIADGHHLLPEEIQVIYKVKGPENLILTSDVNHLIGMAPGRYFYMGSEVIYTEDGLVKNPKLNCLAGASLPLKKGVETMMNFTGCSLGDAINLASKNVAKIYGLKDRGTLEPGRRADIILFEKRGNQINIKETYLKGKLVFSN